MLKIMIKFQRSCEICMILRTHKNNAKKMIIVYNKLEQILVPKK